ncbi:MULTISPECIES: LutC/YkgG family protein [Nocardia]|uniref:Lactate utilization protein C n=2 Tax=Nocardia TaxID=1817 RepID=A0A2T2ZDY4_9NOCA|nr:MULTISPECIES: LUD domain-containing protein [Nocardia]MBF6144347.1 LUD domain-containing protein [Nocardia nova]MBF6242811.1 LUD domain-containing protein [Nocardia elegans]MBF6449440.1 LUD domain-containing protein [Nocardia elegans]MDN2495354.1 lactate utilization protein C [Nocardia nova]PSR65981.1 lactate utilization protein C [Nocardia nova]
MTSREDFLRRVRDALEALPNDERMVPVPRNYQRNAPVPSAEDQAEIVELFIDRLKHHGAQVHRVGAEEIPGAIDSALRAHGARSALAPDGLPEHWLRRWELTGEHRVLDDQPHLSILDRERTDAVVTGCAGAVADAGTLILDGGPGQCRRDAAVLADCHICVVRVEQIDYSLPQVLDKLDPRRSITWFGGPTAMTDPEADSGKVGGVIEETERRLVVVIVG